MAADSYEPAAAALLDRIVSEYGGEELLVERATQFWRGNSTDSNGGKQSVELVVRLPHEYRITAVGTDSGGGGLFEGRFYSFDSEKGALLLDEPRSRYKRREGLLWRSFRWRDCYSAVRLLGLEPVDDQPRQLIELRTRDGDVDFWYVNLEDHSVVRRIAKYPHPRGLIEIREDFSDFCRVDALRAARVVVSSSRIGVERFEMKTHWDSIEFGIPIPDEKVKPPPEVMKLIQQSDSKPVDPRGIGSATEVIPKSQQVAWQELEYQAFIHFGINTFTDREWGDGKEAPAIFNPSEFDARQWVRVFKDAGMKQVILTAKHHDGFCLWPTRYTKHSVASSPWRGGKGDIVRDVSEACREAGLKFGVYISPWDRQERCYGEGEKYNEHFRNQLTELLTQYGPVHEVWFDGACGEGPNGKKQVYDWPSYIAIVRKHAPDAVIFSDAGPDVRWVGNEQGVGGETNWSMLRRDEFYPGTPNYAQLTEGHENGTHWVPAEVNTSIRPGWFYHSAEDDKVKSLAALLDVYYQSVGRNGVMLLNVPPDRRGLIHENDAARLRELRKTLDATFSNNLAGNRPATAIQAGEKRSIAELTDGSWRTAPAERAARYELSLPDEATFDRIMLQEDVRQGQAVKRFTVSAEINGAWKQIAAGTTIGYKRILRIDRTRAARLRIDVDDARFPPHLSEIGVFLASPAESPASAPAR